MNLTSTFDVHCAHPDQLSVHSPPIKLRFSLTTTIIVYIIYLLPFCFGVFGNISVCLIFFQQKKLRSITNTFLMNLCLNDLIVLCVSIPMTLSTTLLEHWVFGEFLCKFLNFTPTLTALVSTFTVATIAVERWFFIVNKKKFDRRCTILTLILLWVISIAIALPEFLSRYIQEFAPTISYPPLQTDSFETHEINGSNISTSSSSCYIQKIYFCVVRPGLHMRLFSYFVITVQYLVPFAFVSVSCYSISRFLKNRMKYMRAYQLPRSANNSIKNSSIKLPITSRLSNLDETTEYELTSHEETPTTIISNENLSKSTSTRNSSKKSIQRPHYQQTMIVTHENFRSSSIVGTILMPNDKAQSHSKRRFHRSRKLLICVAALFTISWLPLTVVQIFLEHNEEITQNEPNFVYGFLLIPCYLVSSLSAWMNPVIYNYINRSFRREFYALYPCCFRFSSSSLSSSMSIADPTTNAELPSSICRRVTRYDYPSPPTREDSTMLFTPSTQKSTTRTVSFSDRESNGKNSVVLVNEQI